MLEDFLDLGDRYGFAPVGKLDDRPDLQPFAWLALDSEKLPERRGLPRDPRRIGCVSEPSVVGHDREDVQVLRLSFQVDRQLGAKCTGEFGVRPRAVEGAEQCAGRSWSRISGIRGPNR